MLIKNVIIYYYNTRVMFERKVCAYDFWEVYIFRDVYYTRI